MCYLYQAFKYKINSPKARKRQNNLSLLIQGASLNTFKNMLANLSFCSETCRKNMASDWVVIAEIVNKNSFFTRPSDWAHKNSENLAFHNASRVPASSHPHLLFEGRNRQIQLISVLVAYTTFKHYISNTNGH